MVLEYINLYPRISIVVISALVSLFISAVNYFVMDKEKVRTMKARQKEIQKELKLHKKDEKKTAELSKELLEHSMNNLRHSFKPMLITLIPILAVFWWIRNVFEATALASTWFWWYLVAAIAFSLIFRKLFKLP